MREGLKLNDLYTDDDDNSSEIAKKNHQRAMKQTNVNRQHSYKPHLCHAEKYN